MAKYPRLELQYAPMGDITAQECPISRRCLAHEGGGGVRSLLPSGSVMFWPTRPAASRNRNSVAKTAACGASKKVQTPTHKHASTKPFVSQQNHLQPHGGGGVLVCGTPPPSDGLPQVPTPPFWRRIPRTSDPRGPATKARRPPGIRRPCS